MTERWIVEDTYQRLEGDIRGHPHFKGWASPKHNQAFVLADGKLRIAFKQSARKSESRLCAENCKKAHPLTPCSCACGGENHGTKYDGHEIVTEVEAEEWDTYVDELVAPGM